MTKKLDLARLSIAVGGFVVAGPKSSAAQKKEQADKKRKEEVQSRLRDKLEPAMLKLGLHPLHPGNFWATDGKTVAFAARTDDGNTFDYYVTVGPEEHQITDAKCTSKQLPEIVQHANAANKHLEALLNLRT